MEDEWLDAVIMKDDDGLHCFATDDRIHTIKILGEFAKEPDFINDPVGNGMMVLMKIPKELFKSLPIANPEDEFPVMRLDKGIFFDIMHEVLELEKGFLRYEHGTIRKY